MGGMPNMGSMGGMPNMGGMGNDLNVTPSLLNNQLDVLLQNEGMLDSTIQRMMPHASEEEKAAFKVQFTDNCKQMRDNPQMMNFMTEQMQNMMNNPAAMNNMMNNMGVGGMPNMMNNQMNPNMMNNNQPNMSPMMNQNNPMMNQNNPMMNGMSPMMNNQMNPGMMNQNYNQFGYYDPLTRQNYQFSPTKPCCHGFYPFDYIVSVIDKAQAAAPKMTDEEAKIKYKEQLEQMEQMGLNDKAENIKALIKFKGNLDAAVNYLFDQNN